MQPMISPRNPRARQRTPQARHAQSLQPARNLRSAALVMPPRPHILVVNGRKVRQPVFVIGAPHSGADLLARALKRSAGFHLTIGQPSVMSVVNAFARSPSIQRGRGEAAATVLRDAFAQAWQVTAHGCLGCSLACRDAGGVNGAGVCVAERDIRRYGDATPDLMYCAEGLVDAFPDARIVQIIPDGRDVAAIGVRARGRGGPLAIQSGGWRRMLTAQQVTEVEQVAGIDLRRVGYGT